MKSVSFYEKKYENCAIGGLCEDCYGKGKSAGMSSNSSG